MKIVQKINAVFISLLLSLIYICVIGISKILYIFMTKKIPKQNTFWHLPNKQKTNKNELRSAY